MYRSARDLVYAINGLKDGVYYRYPNPRTSTVIRIMNVQLPEGPITIKRFNPYKSQPEISADTQTISPQMLWRVAGAIQPGTPLNIDRIFVQQLGRGLRISPGKDKVIVLDFVSDIRRFAAGIELKDELAKADKYIKLGTPVHFVNQAGEDKRAEHFLREWIKDVAEVQDADEDAHILKYPPPLS